jgi:hypothetical protein
MPGGLAGHSLASRKRLTCFLVNGILRQDKITAFVKDLEAKDAALTTVFATLGPWLALNGIAMVGFTASGVAAGDEIRITHTFPTKLTSSRIYCCCYSERHR